MFVTYANAATKKAEPPPTRDANRGTDSANGGWLRRFDTPLVNLHTHNLGNKAQTVHIKLE